ncbi:MAG: hypothetical protein ABH879_09320 [archaeon]
MKKAQGMDPLRVLILTLIVGGILMVFSYTKVYPAIMGSGERNLCTFHILKAHFTRIGSAGFMDSQLPCDPQRKVITFDDVKTDGKIDDDKVKRIIADEMLAGWRMTGNGTLDPIDDYSGDKKYCMIYTTLEFDRGFLEQQKKEGYNLTSLWHWLATNPVPKKRTTYYRELTGNEPTPEQLALFSGIEGDRINTTKEHVVVWRIDADKHDLMTDVLVMAGAGIGMAAGIAAVPITLGASLSVTAASAGVAAGTMAYIAHANYQKSDTIVIHHNLLFADLELLGRTITDPNNPEEEDRFCTILLN